MLDAKKMKRKLEKIEKKQRELAVLEAKTSKIKKEIAKEIAEFKLLQQPQPQPQQKIVTQLGDTGANITITKQKAPQGTQTL